MPHNSRSVPIIQEEGVEVAVRRTVNFVGAAITAADDAANERVNVTVALALEADSVKDTHIDWGAGAGQVDADDVPESATKKWAGETGADVTGSNAPQAHAASHQNVGADEISVAGLSGLLADGQTPLAHKDSHDPEDGSDPVDTAAASEIAGVQAAATGTSHSLARADHAHQIQHGITDNHLVTVDDASVADDDFARFTANGVEGITVAEAITALLAVALPENVAIVLDPALSADGKYSGIVETGTAGAALAFGDICYLQTADSRWELANAATATVGHNFKLGICVLAAVGDGSATTMLLWGKVRADTAFPALTVGAPVYLGEVAGDVQTTAPSDSTDIVRIVGYGNTSEELFFHPDLTYIQVA